MLCFYFSFIFLFNETRTETKKFHQSLKIITFIRFQIENLKKIVLSRACSQAGRHVNQAMVDSSVPADVMIIR
jgi:hypothetical protein